MDTPNIQSTTAAEVLAELAQWIGQRFTVVQQDSSRPWGGFLVLHEDQADAFAAEFFPEVSDYRLAADQKLSPKILLVAPHQRLSWQYHFRRSELWKVVKGPVAVATSNDDTERVQHVLQAGELIRLACGERHRLMGLDGFGVVAEIWQHTDANQPSDESDIVRVQDDYSR